MSALRGTQLAALTPTSMDQLPLPIEPAQEPTGHAVLAALELDHVQHRVDQRQVGERLRKVAQMLAGVRIDLLAVELKGPANESSLAQSLRARWYSPISHRAETSQNEQMVKLPSSPANPSSVSSTL